MRGVRIVGVREMEIVARIRRAAGKPRSGLLAGIGDDCAIYRPRGAVRDLLFTTDMALEEVHFQRETHSAAEIGYKALARGLSDIAAMGGDPRLCFVSLAVSDPGGTRWVDGFYRGLFSLARRTGTILAGGDLAHAPKIACDIVVCGDVPRGKALRRDGARTGDRIYVSGALGASSLGLRTRTGPAWRRHRRPEPRLELGKFLRERLEASAAMDLSDGLSIDLRRLCLASGVAADISAPPIFRGARIEDALHGGEDYELLFTVSPGTAVPPAFGRLKLTEIGRIRKGPAGSVTLSGKTLPALGYDHFRS